MSDTPPDSKTAALNAVTAGFSTIMSAPAGSEPTWAKPAVAIFAMVLLAGVIAYSIVIRDHDTMILCVGAVISMATGAGNYYLGSSSGSARKTDLLAAAPAVVPAT